jgi:hypothetical protein
MAKADELFSRSSLPIELGLIHSRSPVGRCAGEFFVVWALR